MNEQQRKEIEYSRYLDSCLAKKKKVDHWLSFVFVYICAINITTFALYFYLYGLSSAFMGSTYAKELWYPIPMVLLALAVCYKRDKRFCFAAPILIVLMCAQPQRAPLGGIVRGLNVVGCILCLVSLRYLAIDRQLRDCEEYPYFSLRANTNPKEDQDHRAAQAREELRQAETTYSTAPQQGYMDDLVVQPAETAVQHTNTGQTVMEDLIVAAPLVQLEKEEETNGKTD